MSLELGAGLSGLGLLAPAPGPFGLAAGAVASLLGGGHQHVPVAHYTPSATASNIDTAKLLAGRPDVGTEFNNLANRDVKSKQMLSELGITTPDQFAQYWYDTHGANEGVDPTPFLKSTTGGGTPVATDPTSTATTPSTSPTATNNLNDSISQLLGLFNQQQQNAITQQNTQASNRSMVQSTLGDAASKIDNSIFGTSIQDILSGQKTQAQTQLDRGLARGMYNDVGYQAGEASLGKNYLTAQNKLNTTASDLLGGYRTKYNNVLNDALNAAGNSTSTFDLTPYQKQEQEIVDQAKSSAPGALQDAIGSSPLFDLNTIRGDAGTAQGALNLNNLDVLDALAKRKQANGVGRGLGSQGSF